jgi:hypothetical protein
MNKSRSLVSRIGPFCSVLLILALGVGWRPEPPEPDAVAIAPIAVPIQSPPEESIVQSSAAAADFDGDGDKEIVIGDTAGWLYVATYGGASWSMAWSRQTAIDLNAAGAPVSCATTDKSDIRSSVAIGDLDGDGDLEIVVTTGGSPAYHRNGGVLVYTYNGDSPWSFSVVPGWPLPNTDDLGTGDGLRQPDGCWDGIEGSPALGDLDGDGDMEIVVSSLNRHLYAWHHDGTPVEGWPIHRDNGDNILRGGLSSPALGDIDGDGLLEVVVGTNSPPWPLGEPQPPKSEFDEATVWAINGDSSNVPGWPVTTNNNVYSSPAIGDIDGDDELEVVVGSGPSVEGGDGRYVYAWNPDGSPVNGWPIMTGGDTVAPPALGDLDGDDDLEIVIGCGKEFDTATTCTSLYAWHGDGTAVSGFPMSPGSFTQPYSPILADYDGDGNVEILVVDQTVMGLAIVENNGVLSGDTTYNVPSILYNAPLVDDVDNDGQLEITMGGFAVYIFDTTTSASAAVPWPMFHHDPYRTGNIAFNPDNTPPQNPTVGSSTHTASAWSNDNQVQMDWSGAADDESGIGGYYYAWDTSATTSIGKSASRLDENTSTLISPLDDGASWYFHLRAVNGAGLLAEDTVHFGPVMVDTLAPVSEASGPACAVASATVSWDGNDAGSGLASYDVQVRAGASGSWTDWKSATTDTSDVYSGATGTVYQFRSLARDAAGNLEVKGDGVFDVETWLTQYSFSGTVYNVQDEPIFGAAVTSSPAVPLSVKTDLEGKYVLCHQDPGAYDLAVSRTGFGALPAMKNLSGTLAGLDFYLPPVDDAVVNGQFELGDLSGWTTSTLESGTANLGLVTVTDTAHTGDYAAELSDGGSVTWTAALSQSLSVPGALDDPTLSFVYRLAGDGMAWVAVQGSSQTLSEPLSTTPMDQDAFWGQAASTQAATWSHAWMDLSVFQGETVTVALHLDGEMGGVGSLAVDEISLGSLSPGAWRIYLPVTLRQS